MVWPPYSPHPVYIVLNINFDKAFKHLFQHSVFVFLNNFFVSWQRKGSTCCASKWFSFQLPSWWVREKFRYEMLIGIIWNIFLEENCLIPGLLTNLEYASCPAILQVTFTLILPLAVFILKKKKFSEVIGVEQNLNTTRVFNSAFTFGPGICLFLGSTMLTLMSSKRMFPILKADHEVGTLSSKHFHANNSIIDLFQSSAQMRLLSLLILQTFTAMLPYFNSSHLRNFTKKRLENQWQYTMKYFKWYNRVDLVNHSGEKLYV